jgi:hypothetical protein
MFFVYLLTSQPHGTLYVGMTDDLIRRIWEHKNKVVPGFRPNMGLGLPGERGLLRPPGRAAPGADLFAAIGLSRSAVAGTPPLALPF